MEVIGHHHHCGSTICTALLRKIYYNTEFSKVNVNANTLGTKHAQQNWLYVYMYSKLREKKNIVYKENSMNIS